MSALLGSMGWLLRWTRKRLSAEMLHEAPAQQDLGDRGVTHEKFCLPAPRQACQVPHFRVRRLCDADECEQPHTAKIERFPMTQPGLLVHEALVQVLWMHASSAHKQRTVRSVARLTFWHASEIV